MLETHKQLNLNLILVDGTIKYMLENFLMIYLGIIYLNSPTEIDTTIG